MAAIIRAGFAVRAAALLQSLSRGCPGILLRAQQAGAGLGFPTVSVET